MSLTPIWHRTVEQMTQALVEIPSISNPDDPSGENAVAHKIKELIQTHTDLPVTLQSISEDDTRLNVFCLLKGQHADNHGETVILLSHYDTVSVDEFGVLSDDLSVAFNPDAIANILHQRDDLPPAIQEVLNDTWTPPDAENTESAWMFGRGALDMKSAVAIKIAVLSELHQHREQLRGNILFVSCPDEENESAGVLGALDTLIDLREEKELTYSVIINTDYTTSTDGTRPIYNGTIGKLLPSFYVLGSTTHVGEPFRGIDANEIAAELVRRINLNPDLCDEFNGNGFAPKAVTVPPITLKLQDTKIDYNVQTAHAAFLYFNMMTYTYSPRDVLEKLSRIATEAMQTVLGDIAEKYRTFSERFDQSLPINTFEINVLSFSDVLNKLSDKLGGQSEAQAWLQSVSDDIRAEYQTHESSSAWQEKFDNRVLTRLLMGRAIEKAGIPAPAVIIGFSPPYYAHALPSENSATKIIETMLSEGYHQKLGEQFVFKGHYPYISDMSYLGMDEVSINTLGEMQQNTPLLLTDNYDLPLESLSQLSIPMVNIGPWGYDVHGLYERVYKPYSFQKLPQFLFDLLWNIFAL